MWSRGSWSRADLQGSEGEVLLKQAGTKAAVDLPKVPEDREDPGLPCLLWRR